MRFLSGNLALKLVSLVLAGLLWFVIAGETTSEMGISVPLELQNFPKDLELTGDPVDAVEVRLRASPGIMHALGPGEISAQIDLSGSGEGERIIHLTADSVRVPFGVKVVKIAPSLITLNFERTLQKAVPIRPRLVGRPAPGFEVAVLTSDPSQVRIAGPKSRVEELESAFTEPVSVDGADATVSEERNIGLEDPLLRIQGSPRVTVTARVRELRDKRIFEAVVIGVRNGTALLSPDSVRVVVVGPVSVLRRLSDADVKAYVDVGGLAAPGLLAVAVELSPGHAGASVEATDPAEVQARPVRKRG
jgi:YbbR domain-containing protein